MQRRACVPAYHRRRAAEERVEPHAVRRDQHLLLRPRRQPGQERRHPHGRARVVLVGLVLGVEGGVAGLAQPADGGVGAVGGVVGAGRRRGERCLAVLPLCTGTATSKGLIVRLTPMT